MKTIKTTLATTAIFSDDGLKRYLLTKSWDSAKPNLAIIMLAPSEASGVALDNTTMLVLNNASRLGYGSVTILNLFATLNDFGLKQAELEDPENRKVILSAAKAADVIVYAAGVGKAKNKLFQERQKQVLTELRPMEAKLFCLCTKEGTAEYDDRNGYEYYLFGQVDSHPSWHLITLKYHQTAIEQFLGISLDGGRCFVTAPLRAIELLEMGISNVAYYIQDDLQYRTLQFFLGTDPYEYDSLVNYMRLLLVFQSEPEYQAFITYVKNNLDQYHSLYAQQGDTDMPCFPDLPGYYMDEFKKECRDALVLKKMYKEFASSSPLTT